MGRPPCCDESGVKKGPWTPEEDEKLMDYISKHGRGTWGTLPKHAGLNRCGKSCRLRWENYLRPDIKRGKFNEEEEQLIINLHSVLGNKWSKIASHLPGRTDNEIKNYWNTHIRKKLLHIGIDPETHTPRNDFNHLMNISQLLGISNLGTSTTPCSNPFFLQVLQNMLQLMNNNSLINMGNPYLLANQNLNLNPLDTFLNGTNTLQIKEPIFTSQEYAKLAGNKPGLLFSETHGDSSQQNFLQSGTEKESETSEEVLRYNKSSTTLQENQADNLLPPLVAFNQMDSNCNAPPMSGQSPSPATFEAWEKFLIDDDEAITSTGM